MTPLKLAWHNIRRSPYQSLVAVMVMSISFFSLSLFAMVSYGLGNVLNYFETKPEITIFLKDGLDRATVESLQKELADYPSIREIKFISKEKALSLYQQQNKDNPLLTEMVTASILPASFEVSVTDITVLEQISQNFSAKKDQVDEIIYQKDIIQNILSWTGFVRRVGLAVVVSSSLFSFLIITIIIGMKINTRKEEIGIYRSLGASSFYVKRPFLLEGTFYGLIGGMIGLLLTTALLASYYRQIYSFFQPISFFPDNFLPYFLIIIGSLSAGIFIGISASYFGVKRYIRF